MRVTNEQLTELLAVLPKSIRRDLAADLKDARERIAELERFSASQEEALSLMERGKL